jgi:cell division transport system ATP-binding protein
MIQLFHLSKKYDNHIALDDIDLRIEKGEFVFVTGPSGAGKTTLLRLLFGAEKPEKGYILINSINLTRISRSKMDLLRRRIGFVFQDFKLLPQRTVFENVAIALQVTGEPAQWIRKKTRQTLELVGLEDKEKVYPLSLSGGEQQRVAIARAVVKGPVILLADEPTGNLDPDLTREIMALFRSIHQKGTTVVIATHSRDLLENAPYRTILLQEGRLSGDTCA